MAGSNAIWRATSNADTFPEPQGINTDKIEFEVDNVIPDSTGHIVETSINMTTGIAENEKAFGNTNELQFTKFEGITITIVGSIKNPISSLAAVKLKVWNLEDQDINNWTKGRFGLRLNDFPIFNVKPCSSSSGHARAYSIQSLTFNRADLPNRIGFTLVMRLSGNLLDGTGSNYDWS
jgi:hypothetical protein